MMIKGHPSLGVGIYSRSEAARLLKMTPSRVTRWIRGYCYSLAYASKRHAQPPVIRSTSPEVDGAFVLSFLDLMELRDIRVLVDDVAYSFT
jgi:hypothetical protein